MTEGMRGEGLAQLLVRLVTEEGGCGMEVRVGHLATSIGGQGIGAGGQEAGGGVMVAPPGCGMEGRLAVVGAGLNLGAGGEEPDTDGCAPALGSIHQGRATSDIAGIDRCTMRKTRVDQRKIGRVPADEMQGGTTDGRVDDRVSAMGDEQMGSSGLVAAHSEMEWSHPVAIERVMVRSMVEQELRDDEIAAARSLVEQGPVVDICRIGIGALGEEVPDDGWVGLGVAACQRQLTRLKRGSGSRRCAHGGVSQRSRSAAAAG
jgi:hypothetical protein